VLHIKAGFKYLILACLRSCSFASKSNKRTIDRSATRSAKDMEDIEMTRKNGDLRMDN